MLLAKRECSNFRQSGTGLDGDSRLWWRAATHLLRSYWFVLLNLMLRWLTVQICLICWDSWSWITELWFSPFFRKCLPSIRVMCISLIWSRRDYVCSKGLTKISLVSRARNLLKWSVKWRAKLWTFKDVQRCLYRFIASVLSNICPKHPRKNWWLWRSLKFVLKLTLRYIVRFKFDALNNVLPNQCVN